MFTIYYIHVPKSRLTSRIQDYPNCGRTARTDKPHRSSACKNGSHQRMTNGFLEKKTRPTDRGGGGSAALADLLFAHADQSILIGTKRYIQYPSKLNPCVWSAILRVWVILTEVLTFCPHRNIGMQTACHVYIFLPVS